MTKNAIVTTMRSDEVLAEFQEVLGHSANAFVSSVLITVANDPRLQECTPKSIYVSAMKAANVGLSVGSELGHAYLIAYKNKGILEAQFQASYKGLKQLAMSTGKYRYINSSPIYEGEQAVEDRISGIHHLEGNKKSDKVEGWLAAFELTTGYGKTFYMTVEEIHAHALKCNPGGYNSQAGAWKRYKKGEKNNIMEQKTPLRLLLQRDGYLTPAQAAILKEEEPEPIDVEATDIDDVDSEYPEAQPEPAPTERMWAVSQREALINAGLAKNDFSAKGMLGLSALPVEASNTEIVAWGTIYRANRYDENGKAKMKADQAAMIANEETGLS